MVTRRANWFEAILAAAGEADRDAAPPPRRVQRPRSAGAGATAAGSVCLRSQGVRRGRVRTRWGRPPPSRRSRLRCHLPRPTPSLAQHSPADAAAGRPLGRRPRPRQSRGRRGGAVARPPQVGTGVAAGGRANRRRPAAGRPRPPRRLPVFAPARVVARQRRGGAAMKDLFFFLAAPGWATRPPLASARYCDGHRDGGWMVWRPLARPRLPTAARAAATRLYDRRIGRVLAGFSPLSTPLR